MSAAGRAPGRVLRAKLAACFDRGRFLPARPARCPPDWQPYPPAPPPRLSCLLQQVVSTVIGSTIALMGGWLVLPWYGSTRMLADQAAALRAAAALPRRCGRVDRRGVPRWSGRVCGGWLVPSGVNTQLAPSTHPQGLLCLPFSGGWVACLHACPPPAAPSLVPWGPQDAACTLVAAVWYFLNRAGVRKTRLLPEELQNAEQSRCLRFCAGCGLRLRRRRTAAAPSAPQGGSSSWSLMYRWLLGRGYDA